jgi:hypothetical protein
LRKEIFGVIDDDFSRCGALDFCSSPVMVQLSLFED